MTSSLAGVLAIGYRIHRLKSWRVTVHRGVRRLWFDAKSLNPIPYLVETKAGTKFKLLRADRANRSRLKLLLYTWDAVKTLDFVPRIIWHDEHNILFEYVEGAHPNLADVDFARAFGRNLARVNALDVDALEASTVIRTAQVYLSELVSNQLISNEYACTLIDGLGRRIPCKMRTSLVYQDMQAGNFCLTEDDRLVFIDLGGFQRGRLADEGFVGHGQAGKIDFSTFERSYLESGGTRDLFQWKDIIVALSDLRRGARLSMWSRNLSALRGRTRKAYGVRAQQHVERLRQFADSTDSRQPLTRDVAVL